MPKKKQTKKGLRYYAIKADGKEVDHEFTKKDAKRRIREFIEDYWWHYPESTVWTIEEGVLESGDGCEEAYEYDGPETDDYDYEAAGLLSPADCDEANPPRLCFGCKFERQCCYGETDETEE